MTADDISKTTSRLAQLTSQLPPTAKPVKARKKKSQQSEGPADYSDILSELAHIRSLAQTPLYNTTGYKRHREAGKLWVRKRVELLLDTGSFREVGSVAGQVTWVKKNKDAEGVVEREREVVGGFVASNNVQGTFLIGS
jgi:acetyl-CoA carboxylase carboxyltransferase component